MRDMTERKNLYVFVDEGVVPSPRSAREDDSHVSHIQHDQTKMVEFTRL